MARSLAWREFLLETCFIRKASMKLCLDLCVYSIVFTPVFSIMGIAGIYTGTFRKLSSCVKSFRLTSDSYRIASIDVREFLFFANLLSREYIWIQFTEITTDLNFLLYVLISNFKASQIKINSRNTQTRSARDHGELRTSFGKVANSSTRE